jgi:branched-chain amino acid transport system ATP-binding protein
MTPAPAQPIAGHPLLTIRNLSVSYGKIEAVHKVNLEVPAGKIVAVIGPNGAGKSTVLNAIMGTLPPFSGVTGEIDFDRESIVARAAEDRVAQGISLVPEKRELFTSMSVEDNLKLGAYRHHQARDKTHAGDLARIYEIFPRLKERCEQLAGTLSGGERQMLALVRALMATPRLLMLDEPSLGLAPRIVQEIFRVIADLRATGVAIILVEQNARAALQVADHGYVLESGEVGLHGAAADLAHNPRVIEAYLGLGRH